MMNISKVQAHNPQAAKLQLQLFIVNCTLKQISVSRTFFTFPDHFGIPWLFQVVQVSGHPEPNLDKNKPKLHKISCPKSHRSS